MELDYNLTREKAAEILEISTRTLDRRIRKGKISHTKDVNKVMLSKQEIEAFKENENKPNVVLDSNSQSPTQIELFESETDKIVNGLSKQFEQQSSKFIEIINAKDLKIEHKNQVIMSLQQRIFEMEQKLKNTVALPMFEDTKKKIILEKKHLEDEKKDLLLEKEHLEYEKRLLDEEIKKEKIKNIAMLGMVILFVIILIIVVSR